MYPEPAPPPAAPTAYACHGCGHVLRPRKPPPPGAPPMFHCPQCEATTSHRPYQPERPPTR